MTNSKLQMPDEENRKKSKKKEVRSMADAVARNEAVAKDDSQSELDNVKNQLARALADYQNQNKRFQEERAQIFQYAGQQVLEHLIPVLDILEKAQEHLQDQGLGLAISEFKRVLRDEGLEEIVPKLHNPFEHELMEVVESVEDDGEKETVAETVLNGWKFKDGKVVRYAKVKVYTGKE